MSGAVAERIKYHSFILFSFLMAIVIYPVTGHWIWGFGYLAKEWNFWDFAGCTAVHSVGGWGAISDFVTGYLGNHDVVWHRVFALSPDHEA